MARKKTADLRDTKEAAKSTLHRVVFSPEDIARLQGHLISPSRLCAEKGLDWDDESTAIVENKAELIEKAYAKAQEMNKKHPDKKATWRDFL